MTEATTALRRAGLIHLLMLVGRTVLTFGFAGLIFSEPGAEDYLYLFLGVGFVISASGTALAAVLLLVGARRVLDDQRTVAWAW